MTSHRDTDGDAEERTGLGSDPADVDASVSDATKRGRADCG